MDDANTGLSNEEEPKRTPKFTCSACSRIFMEDENAYKRHTKKCRYDLVQSLPQGQRSFLGSWVLRKPRVDPESLVSYPAHQKITLAADGVIKYQALSKGFASFIKGTGVGDYTWTQDTISYQITIKEKEYCTRCGDPPHIERRREFKLIETHTHEQFKKHWHREFELQCYFCKKTGHVGALCPERNCFICGLPGHIAKKCPTPDVERPVCQPKEEVQNQEEILARQKKFFLSAKEIIYKEKSDPRSNKKAM